MDEDETVDLTPLIKGRLAWDLIEHDKMREWLPRLGLTPPGDESLEMDHQACHRRAQLVAPLSTIVDVYASLLADIHAAYVIHETGDAFPLAERAEAREDYADIAFRMIQSSALSIVAEFLQDGLLAYGPSMLGED